MLTIEDEDVLVDFERAERDNPSPRKVINDNRTIYVSREIRHPTNHAWGYPVLCDFGEARIGDLYNHEWIQPEVYRAPEIIMEMGRSHSVDIWNTACLVWDLLENNHLFDGQDEDGQYSNRFHIAEMVAYLGVPPIEFRRRSTRSSLVIDETGCWKENPALPPITLELAEKKLQGTDKDDFLDFMRCMLTWLPEKRPTARELLRNAWQTGQV